MQVKKRTLKANAALRTHLAQSPMHQTDMALDRRFRWPTLLLMVVSFLMYCVLFGMFVLHIMRVQIR